MARPVLYGLLIAVTVGLIVGSVAEINAQSGGYRSSIDSGYGALAARVVDASNETGSELAYLMGQAPQMPNGTVPRTARAKIQQGLDQAVDQTSQEVKQAASLVPPYPTGQISARFTQVLSQRAQAAASLRKVIDRLLGMAPISVAGAPSTPVSVAQGPLISATEAASTMTAVGALFLQADFNYRTLLTSIHAQRLAIHLPTSVWVPRPTADAPLGPTRLGAAATLLSQNPALAPVHQLVITSVGLTPPAVTTGGPGVVGDSCVAPQSTVPGPAPTLLPPTGVLSVAVTVTNCGTVVESGVTVTQTLVLADPPGTAPPRSHDRGKTTDTTITLNSGASSAIFLPPLPVAAGHLYELTVAVAVPPTANPLGATQKFLLQISA
jgi:hypothetical protein